MMPDWGRCRWISAGDCETTPMPLFRRAFHIDRPVKRAVAFICGLGQFELHMNGKKTGDDVLEPGWTNYAKTCLYVTHDVTDLLRQGENVIGVMLGNGMYNVTGKRYKKFKGTFGPPKLIAQLHIEHEDGGSTIVPSDSSWRTAPGPITFSCIYGGEDYDARREQQGWDGPAFDDGKWRPVDVVDGPGGELSASTAPPIRVMRTLEPVNITEPSAGVKVYDLGRNFSGWPKISIDAPPGTTISLVTGELLDDAGRVTQRNTGRPVSFSYTSRGGGAETWHPRFSYTGFRYVEVAGLSPDVQLTVSGDFVHSSAEVVGRFECSNPLFNQIHELILSAIRSNMQSVLTDCPHREKLGWLEQTHLMGPAILFNFDAASLYRKVSRDMRDAQQGSGCVPTIAPQYTSFKPPWDVFNDSPEWGSACVVNPWLIYQRTGDRAMIEENYDSMRRYLAYLASRADGDGIIAYGLGDWYDIGGSSGDESPGAPQGDPGFSKLTTLGLTATAMYFLDLTIMQRVAELLGRNDDTERYAADARKTRAAFNARFFDPQKQQYDTGSQTANAMPLALGMVGERHRRAVLDALIRDIRSRVNHITAGDIGLRFVLLALAENDRSDVIFDLLSRTDAPSYGFQLAQGATTLTEAWDANRKVSQNHFMLGHAEAWFYESLAGIQVDLSRPPPQQIQIRPAPVGDISWAQASYRSALGPISVRWDRAGEDFKLQVKIPAGAAAVVGLPGEAEAMREIGAGHHALESRLPSRSHEARIKP